MNIKGILSDVLLLIAMAGICYGVSLLSIPAAIIIASIFVLIISIGLAIKAKENTDKKL